MSQGKPRMGQLHIQCLVLVSSNRLECNIYSWRFTMEIEENNEKEKTSDLYQKIQEIKANPNLE